jgi:hypothetical protein
MDYTQRENLAENREPPMIHDHSSRNLHYES